MVVTVQNENDVKSDLQIHGQDAMITAGTGLVDTAERTMPLQDLSELSGLVLEKSKQTAAEKFIRVQQVDRRQPSIEVNRPKPEPSIAVNRPKTAIRILQHETNEKADAVYQENILDQVVRKLLPKAEADRYIEQYPGNTFRFYVYDDDSLPEEYTWRNVSKCIEMRDRTGNSSCDWGSSICTDASEPGLYLKRRHNRNADVILSKLFSEYNGPLRTRNPHQAELFIVPYPQAGHCQCLMGENPFCRKFLPQQEFQENLLNNLQFYNNTSKTRHLFLASVDWRNVHDFFKNESVAPLVATLGEKKRDGTIVIPYANTNPEYQPGSITDATQSKRHFALSAILSRDIAGDNLDRADFSASMDNVSFLGGKPIHVTLLNGTIRSLPREQQIFQLYRNTTFCPCLRGDGPVQKRIFDVILSGCIPVVMKYEKSSEVNLSSHFRSGGASLRQTYPFAKGTYANFPNMGIDYQGLVIEIEEARGMKSLVRVLEDLLLRNQEKIKLIQRKIENIKSLVSYGMEGNALKYADVVAAILVQARHFVLNQSVAIA